MDTYHSESREGARPYEESCHTKWQGFWSHLPMSLVGAALIMVIGAGVYFFSLLIDNIKDTRVQMRRYEAGRMSVSQYSCALIEDDNPVDPLCKAYEELDRELTSWLTILTIAGALFGLIAPLIGYLLQQHNLKEERKNIKEDVKERVDGISNITSEANIRFERMGACVDERVLHVNEQIKRCEASVIRCVEFPLVIQVNKVQMAQQHNAQIDSIVVANIIIAFDYLLECLVHWDKDSAIVHAKISEWISNIKAVWDKLDAVQQEEVLAFLRGAFKPSSEFASRAVFLKILRADSDEFKWLEEFYKPFAPWKFM